MTACTEASAGCNAKIVELIANDGEMMTIANDTAAVAESWEDASPSKLLAHSSQAASRQAAQFWQAPVCL